MLTLEIPYPPASGNHQHGRSRYGGVFVKPEVRTYRLAIKSLMLAADPLIRARMPLEGRLEVKVDLHPPDKRRRDSGNAIKVIYDALTEAGVWLDDSQAKLERLATMEPVKGGLVRITIKHLEA